ncbi:MAG: hypothetical protein D6729_17685 [Deltaproteobacteria bacterium]|nr:MAG: hypothetical protein D6729_17685 [Deltaproteobacteria bacterium]
MQYEGTGSGGWVLGLRRLSAALLLVLAACEPAPAPNEPELGPASHVPGCRPDNDGIIEAAELPFALGVLARYRVREQEIDIDVDGREEAGVTLWDLSRPDPSHDPLARLGPLPIEGRWFTDRFPNATAVLPLDPRGQLLGAVDFSEEGLRLHGFASAEATPPEGQTLARYDHPVLLLPAPMALGRSWSFTARAENATLRGIPGAFEDRYELEVTAEGRLVLPDLILDRTLRLTVRLERALLTGDVRQVSHHWIHECLGETARVTGPLLPAGEPYPDTLPTIVELRRLSL